MYKCSAIVGTLNAHYGAPTFGLAYGGGANTTFPVSWVASFYSHSHTTLANAYSQGVHHGPRVSQGDAGAR